MQTKPSSFPEQHQEVMPGREHKMDPQPEVIRKDYQGSNKLKGKTALITGGDSGIGRSVAVHFAREGADVAIVYLDEDRDAEATKKMVEKEGKSCLLIEGDQRDPAFAKKAVSRVIDKFGRLDVLVNNAAYQNPKEDIREITPEQLTKTFETNIFGYFYFTQAALDHLPEGSAIINTTSVTAYLGNISLLDYSSTKGAIVAFTRSLAQNLAEKKIRVNGVAPGPIWTPLIPSTFDKEKVASFGQDTLIGRAGQPSELGPAYVFLASQDSSYVTGQVLHVNGGKIVGG